jgi:hypothetical protein
MRDAVIAVIRRGAAVAVYGRPAIETAEAATAAGNVAAEQAEPFLSLVDVKLALLPRIGRAYGAVARVYAEYVRGVRAEAARAEGDMVPADECKAADALLDALGYSAAIPADALGEFMYYTWRRSARYGAAAPTGGRGCTAHRPLYIFNGATYDRVELTRFDRLSCMAEHHMKVIVRSLAMPSEHWVGAAERLVVKFNTRATINKALKRMHDLLKDAALLERDGRMSPVEFESAMDTGAYIGLENGVYDLRNRRLIPKGAVPLNILVSMSTGYAYPKQSDPVIRASIERLLYSIFENNETIDNLMKVLASCFSSTKPREEYYVFTGNGGNGKGVLADLMMAVFGSYLTIDIKRVTTQRVVVVEAPDDRDVRYYAKVWSTRQRKGYTLFILTNNPMERGHGPRRADPAQRVVRFPFQFVGRVKATEPCHRVGDPNVKDMARSDAWGAEMCLMLIETYAACAF